MSDTLYAEEKLCEALDEIIAGKGSLRDRLWSAASYLIRLKSEDIPDRHRAAFAAVIDALTRYPAKRKGEGALSASVRRLRKDELAAVARTVMSIYVDMYCHNHAKDAT
jgi:hypothetical protein